MHEPTGGDEETTPRMAAVDDDSASGPPKPSRAKTRPKVEKIKSKSSEGARAYATWLIASNYIPLPEPVGDVDGVSVAAVWRAENTELPDGDPRTEIAAAARNQQEIAASVAVGGSSPKGWPGRRCLELFRARTSEA